MNDIDKTRKQLLKELKILREKERMSAEIMKRKNLESLGVLAGGIAHDFNNLLTSVMGNISMARMLMHDGAKLNRVLVRAVEISSSGMELAQKLMTFSEGGNPENEEKSLYALIEDTLEADFPDSKVKIEKKISCDLWRINGDEAQLKLVFKNLILNAVQAVPENGSVLIGGENVSLPGGNEFLPTAGNYVKLSIEDNGTGIPPENIDKIFDPYFSTRNESTQHGLGLGLSICQSIISQHNGHISVESEVGKGTVINVYVPAVRE
ncbi:MAG: hypothetical protein GY757_57770 [bacterium]|nr:hypothetical protein [bacterium]